MRDYRDKQIGGSRSEDIALLRKAIAHLVVEKARVAGLFDDSFDYLESTLEAFRQMLDRLEASGAHALDISPKQRAWVSGVLEKLKGEPQYENLVSRGLVPRGKEVSVPPTLRNLPKRPPPRKAEG